MSKTDNSARVGAKPQLISKNITEKSDGHFAIPHKIFQTMIQSCQGRAGDMAVMACLLRFTLGFRRSQARCSLSFIARWTGLAASNVARSLKSLESRGLIISRQKGQGSSSTLFEVPLSKDGLIVTKQLSNGHQMDTKPGNVQQTSNKVSTKSVQEAPKPTQIDYSGVVNLSTKKERVSKKESSSLKQHGLFEDYFKKLDSHFHNLERARLKKLLNENSDKEVLLAFRHIQKNGTISSHERCKLIFSYISRTSVERILTITTEEAQKLQKSHQLQLRQKEVGLIAMKSEKEAEAATQMRVQTFRKLFQNPGIRTAKISEILNSRLSKNFQPTNSTVREMMAAKFHSEELTLKTSLAA